ncbi:MAG: DNA-binding protein [Thermoplasmatales archaeon SG8-52-3]|nr:MAG: DNA-binding protein [Thermoplasmatales archaeon SG8-52-3]
MNLKDCLSKGLIRKDKFAPERVKKSLEIAERFLSASNKNIEIEELEMAEIASYNSIFHSARSLLFKKEYTERSHICVILALKEFYTNNHELIDLLNTFDKIRISRHNIQYGGILIDIEEAEFVYEFAKQFLEETKKITKNEG